MGITWRVYWGSVI